MTKKHSISSDEKQYLDVLKRLSEISGIAVKDLLKSYWECECEGAHGENPFIKSNL